MIRRLAIICFGWLFIVLGVAGLFLPVLQGILFLCVGLIILSLEYKWARQILQKGRERFPVVDRQCHYARKMIASLQASWPKKRRMIIAIFAGLILLTVAVVCAFLLGVSYFYFHII
jgi:uncharacterized membrane protein YbaN (DUF454 family)